MEKIKLIKMYLRILFPFLDTIHACLFGVPFIFAYWYLEKNIMLSLAVFYLSFWGIFLSIEGFNRFNNAFKKLKPNVQYSLLLRVSDLILVLLFIFSILYIYKTRLNSLMWIDYLFTLYFFLPILLGVYLKIKKQ